MLEMTREERQEKAALTAQTLPVGEKKCSRCEKVLDIAKDFGYREYKFRIYVQSQCGKCRAKKPVFKLTREREKAQKEKQEMEEIGRRLLAVSIDPPVIEEKKNPLNWKKGSATRALTEAAKAVEKPKKVAQEPACKMIGYCCITMLGGIGDGLGCMYCRKPMEESEHPEDIKRKAKALAEEKTNAELHAEEIKKDPEVRKEYAKLEKKAALKIKLKPQPKPAPKAEPKLKHIWISGDKGTLRIQYKQYFPLDTNGDKRAAKFMIQKLAKKLGDKAKLTATAKNILEA